MELTRREANQTTHRRILGLGFGLDYLGYAVVDAGRGVVDLAMVGAIETHHFLNLTAGITELAEVFSYLLDELAPVPTCAVMEEFHTRTGVMIRVIGEALSDELARRGIGTEEMAPEQVRLTIGGSVRAPTVHIEEAVCKLLKLYTVPRPRCALEAIAVAVTAAIRMESP